MHEYKYPFLDLRKINSDYSAELKEAAERVIDSGRYIGGEETERLSRKLQSFTGCKHCIPVSNGLDGLRLTLRAFVESGRIEAGREVIVPVNSFIASALAIVDAGLRPVFVDPKENNLLLDERQAESLINDRTGAIMSVDLYGRVWEDRNLLDRIREQGIIVIEDAAQALGAMSLNGSPAGSIGEAGVFSFYPTKNVGALGDAGAVVTSDDEIAEIIGMLANYGRGPGQSDYMLKGYNCRMDPLQAAMLCVKLYRIDHENSARKANAALYRKGIHNEHIKIPSDEPGMTYHQFVVRITKYRDMFRKFLETKGVETAIHYPTPLDLEPCMSEYVDKPSHRARNLAGEIVSLPISSATTPEDVEEIVKIINAFSPVVFRR